MTERIEILIAKYCSDELSHGEMEIFIEWIESGKNKKALHDYIAINYTIEELKSRSEDDSILWNHIESSFKTPTRKLNYWKYVAAAVIVLGFGYYFQQGAFKPPIDEVPVIVNTSIVPGTDKATLTLGDGSTVVLEEGNTFSRKNVRSSGDKIVYEASKNKTKQVIYNYLTIPRGGQYHVKLSDGTEVWLNSETQLKYPASFIDGETRQVELVYGEVYFDVSPSSENNGTKFKVLNQSQEIEVLGTEFNIKAYKDETNIYTTLVEGKVTVDNGVLKQSLMPNQQSNLDTKTNDVKVVKVDAGREVSWKHGIFNFKGKPLKDVMKIISRWYDVDVVFENKELEAIKIKGGLGKHQDIEEILSTIKTLSIIKNYKINGKTITLK
ncbi:MAG: FecR domain-containing protein [Algibacter sp.]